MTAAARRTQKVISLVDKQRLVDALYDPQKNNLLLVQPIIDFLFGVSEK